MAAEGCAAPIQTATPANFDSDRKTDRKTDREAARVVLAGTITGENGPVGGAFVRLLDAGGDFTGEVVSSPAGDFRFYAAPGTWTIRALHRSGRGEVTTGTLDVGVHRLTVNVR